jgi:hypothetical protein
MPLQNSVTTNNFVTLISFRGVGQGTNHILGLRHTGWDLIPLSSFSGHGLDLMNID